MSSPRNDRRAALLRADRGTGAGGDAARGGRVRAPARTRRRLRQAARSAGRDLARVDDGLARSPARRARRVDRRGRAARRGRRARVVAPPPAAVGRADAPLPAVVGGDRAARVRRDGTARRLLARRLADREADGHGVHQRRRPRGLVPARGPLDGGRGPQLLLPRPPDGGRAREAHGRRARRRLQPCRRRFLRALRRHGVRARRGAGGPRGRRLVGDRAAAAGRDDRLRARPGRRRRSAAELRLVRRLARDRGHDQRVPGVLVHARRPARPRDGDPVLAARARLRPAAGGRRAATAAARAGGARARADRDRGGHAVRDQRLVVPCRRRPVRARRPGAAA